MIPEEDVINIIEKRCSRFTKRDQINPNMVRDQQCVVLFLSNATLKYSTTTNDTQNNLLTLRDIKTCDKVLGHSRQLH